jgi:hypothetical protein
MPKKGTATAATFTHAQTTEGGAVTAEPEKVEEEPEPQKEESNG